MMETRKIFKSVAPLPDYRLTIELETGGKVLFGFGARLKAGQFPELRDSDVFNSVHADGFRLIFDKQDGEQLKIDATAFLDLMLIDRTQFPF